jgi:hypothetical protein
MVAAGIDRAELDGAVRAAGPLVDGALTTHRRAG